MGLRISIPDRSQGPRLAATLTGPETAKAFRYCVLTGYQ
jgi:hypothetical protein